MYADYFLCGFGVVSTRTAAANNQTTTLIIIKKVVYDIIYISFLFAKMMLVPQQRSISIIPNTNTKVFVLSIPCITGVSTITARNT